MPGGISSSSSGTATVAESDFTTCDDGRRGACKGACGKDVWNGKGARGSGAAAEPQGLRAWRLSAAWSPAATFSSKRAPRSWMMPAA